MFKKTPETCGRLTAALPRDWALREILLLESEELDVVKFLGNYLNNGETLFYMGKKMVIEVKKVDAQGRIALPARWRARALKGIREVYVLERDDYLLVKPRERGDLTRHFDAVEVDIEPEDFQDYDRLKKALLEG